MIGSTCPKCGHVGHPTTAISRFRPNDMPPLFAGCYDGAPVRETRAEAEADVCAMRRRAAS